MIREIREVKICENFDITDDSDRELVLRGIAILQKHFNKVHFEITQRGYRLELEVTDTTERGVE